MFLYIKSHIKDIVAQYVGFYIYIFLYVATSIFKQFYFN